MQANSATVQQAKEWFDLTRYLPAARLTLDDWIGQIAKRASIEAAIKVRDKPLQQLDKELQDVVAHLDALVGGLVREPLADWPFKYSNVARAVNDSNPATSSVVPLGFHDLDRLQFLRQGMPPQGIHAIDEWVLDKEALLALTRFGHLKVDLNARDADILASFERWLSVCRQEPGRAAPKKPYRKEMAMEMSNWHQMKILPYFDLKAWASLSRVHLTELEIVSLLFPNDTDGPTRDKLRSLKDKADDVFTMANVLSLSTVTSV